MREGRNVGQEDGERADREGREEERKEEKEKAFVKCWWRSRKNYPTGN